MKKRTRTIVRIIGVLLLISAIICAIKGYNDGVFNGLDFAVIFFGLLGVYFVFGSEESLASWNLKKLYNEASDEDFEEEDADYEYDECSENIVSYPFPSDTNNSNFDEFSREIDGNFE